MSGSVCLSGPMLGQSLQTIESEIANVKKPKNPKKYLLLARAQLLLGQKNYDGALKDFNAVYERDRTCQEAVIGVLKATTALGRAEDCLRVVGPASHFERACIFGESDRFEDSVKEFKLHLSKYPDDILACKEYLAVLLKANDIPNGLGELMRLKMLGWEGDWELRLLKAKFCFKDNNYRKVVKICEKLEKLFPGLVEIYPFQLVCLYQLGRFNEAILVCNKLLKGDPDDCNVLMYLMKCCLGMDNRLEADKVLEQIVSITSKMIKEGSDDFDAIIMHAEALRYLQRYRQALAFLNQYLLRFPENPELLLNKAYVYKDANRYQKAQSIFAAILEKSNGLDINILEYARMGFFKCTEIHVNYAKQFERLNFTDTVATCFVWLNPGTKKIEVLSAPCDQSVMLTIKRLKDKCWTDLSTIPEPFRTQLYESLTQDTNKKDS